MQSAASSKQSVVVLSLQPPRSTCAQEITRAVSDVACGVAATSLEDTLTVAFKRAERAAERAALRAKSLADPYTASKAGPSVTDTYGTYDSYGSYGTYPYYGEFEAPRPEEAAPEPAAPKRFVGDFGSAAHVAALSAIAQSVFTAAPAASAISDGVQALTALQTEDDDALDEACPASALSAGNRFGSQLATDGAGAAGNASYWLSVGRADALLDIALGSTALVHKLRLDWEYPARDVLVLFSADAAGEDWQLGGTP